MRRGARVPAAVARASCPCRVTAKMAAPQRAGHHSTPQVLAGRGCVRTSLFEPLSIPRYLRARSHRRLKALLMAAEALLQAWSSGMARKAALKGSA